jgi:hypothetical protein
MQTRDGSATWGLSSEFVKLKKRPQQQTYRGQGRYESNEQLGA